MCLDLNIIHCFSQPGTKCCDFVLCIVQDETLAEVRELLLTGGEEEIRRQVTASERHCEIKQHILYSSTFVHLALEHHSVSVKSEGETEVEDIKNCRNILTVHHAAI